MQALPLTSEERLQGFTHRVVLTHEDLTETAANTAQTIALVSVVAGQVLLRAANKVITAFKDASDTAFNSNTLIVGDGGDTDRANNSQQLNENGTEVLYGVNDPAKLPYVFTAADTIDAIVGSMAAKSLSDIDTGEVHILLQIANLNKLTGPATV